MIKVYSCFIQIYGWAINLSALLGNVKAKKWINGRRTKTKRSVKKSVWIHCASLGEFEQAYPVIEEIQQQFLSNNIIVSFFSPSGYDIVSQKNVVDDVVYLPLDTRKNAVEFIDLINPEIAIFVKYEFWFNHLIELKNRNIKTYFISVIVTKNHFLFSSFSKSFRRVLKSTEGMFVQDENSKNLLLNAGFENIHLSGDTRLDRVFKFAIKEKDDFKIEKFKSVNRLIVVGSSWKREEKIMNEFIMQTDLMLNCRVVIAPHDISEKHLVKIEQLFNATIIRYSNYSNQVADIMIIDNIGLLSSIYRYADIAFVGGGFTNALHNILEPAAYGVPVIYGNNHTKFPEALELEEAGGGKSVANSAEFKEYAQRLLNDDLFCSEVGQNSLQFILEKIGATDFIMKKVFKQKSR
jgi:3-deoxy-D-manno-octulosonic-acid transferase